MSAPPVAASLPADGLVITGWSAVSAHGLSRRDFADGVRSGLAAARTEPDGPRLPRPDACLVPDLDRPGLLGREYSYTLDRLAVMALLATDQLLADPDHGPVPHTDERTGLVMGTTMGGKETMAAVIRGSLTNARPFYVEVGLIPGCVMNHSAGAAAIRHDLRGPNATVGGGRVSGLLALNYARRLLDQGRADNCLVGSAEEFAPTQAWLEQAAGTPGEPAPLLGEGCGLLLLEPAGAGQLPPLAAVLAVSTGIDVDDDPQAAVASCARRALDRAGVAPEEVWAAVPTAAPTPEGEAERAALASLVPSEALDRVPSMALLGDTGAASATLQIAALLVIAGADPTAAGRVALVSAVDRDGTVAVAVLRLFEVTS
ncbi:beta-ketoacyl synthase N-terminal-like domain-containing protein [Streptomyces sp. CBMA156]|uniref:beta-ketoacyl synthase N-terminal-like domain-containing protein n=1 Tax=Streptomyces sp. CBMA156 TaxID=1930280 RepID=UPI001661CC1C|nr:beta-ketoacyl synthase N-terminal-like domain-containing protein [Streptomyces sp. CBMA156]